MIRDVSNRIVRSARKAVRQLRRGRRRTWVGAGSAWLELRLREADSPDVVAAAVAAWGETVPGVQWARYNPSYRRVVVQFDPERTGLDDIIGAIERFEAERGVGDAPFSSELPSHPSDREPVVRAWVESAADIAALVASVAARWGGAKTLAGEVDFAALIRAIDAIPAIRGWFDAHLGHDAADLVIGLLRSASDALVQGTTGPSLDVLYRALRLREAMARRKAWAEREVEFGREPAAHAAMDLEGPAAPPLREGAIDAYSASAVMASLGAFGAGVASTRSFERSSAVLFGGLPKPALLGRKSFAAALGASLAKRGFLVNQSESLRRLDRLDCVVVDGALLEPVGGELADVVVLGAHRRPDVRRRAELLFDDDAPFAVRADHGWTLGPVSLLPFAADRQLAESLRHQVGPGGRVLGLAQGNTLVALVAVRPHVHPGAEALVSAVRQQRLGLVVVSETPRVADWSTPDEVILPELLAGSWERLARDGRGLMYVGSSPSFAFRAAHLSVGVPRDGVCPPWGADVVAPHDLSAISLLVEAIGASRRIAKQSIYLAELEAVASLALSLESFAQRTAQRVMAVSNVASFAALLNAVLAAERLRPTPVRHRDYTPWHSLEVDAALARVGSSAEGIGEDVAASKRTPRPAPPSAAVELAQSVADELANPLAPVLAAGAALSALMGSAADAGMVASVLALNGLLGGWQRVRTERAVAALDREEARPVSVRRPGGGGLVPPGDVVVGDVFQLEASDVVPADARIVKSEGLEVDESTLTGESLPIAKSASPSFAAAVADRTSMLYAGTTIAAGRVTAVAVAVGDDTLGSMVPRVSSKRPATGVEARLNELTSLTAPIAGLSGLAVLVAGLAHGRPPRELVGSAVSLAVAAVPEGLPLLATGAQLAAAQRLAQRGALVRNSRAVEALGRVNVVCADKTGTLTEGRIALARVDDGTACERAHALGEARRAVLRLALRATPRPEEGQRLPHPTDQALVDGARLAGVEEDDGAQEAARGDESATWRRLFELPFEPGRGYHAALGREGGRLVLVVKGSPDALLPLCDREHREGGTRRLDAARRRVLARRVEQLAADGLRVLAVAERGARTDAPLEPKRVRRLVFRGLVGLADPVRSTARDAIAQLGRAGVRAVMITGDHPSTARAIAREVGIGGGMGSGMDADGDWPLVMTGPELERLEDDALAAQLERVSVFARVTPDQKTRLVQAFQRGGQVVAMTGDGANDAPAIRLADVGIALGQSATTSARHAADLVVTDGRIETIVHAVLEGRALWASVRNAVAVLVGGNLGEIVFAVTGGLAVGRSPLNARQLLLVNLLTDAWPALTIALRPPPDMTAEALAASGPDAALGSALTRDILWRAGITAGTALGAWVIARATGSSKQADTVALLALVGAQLGQTLILGRGNVPIAVASFGSLAALVALVETPGVNRFFGCAPLGPLGLAQAGLATAAGTATAAVAPWVAKWLRERAGGIELDEVFGDGELVRLVRESRTVGRLLEQVRARREKNAN